MRIPFLLFFFVVLNISVSGQTIDGLTSKYGPARNIFEIRPGVIMSTNFGLQSEVCEMRIERSIGIDKVVLLDKTFASYLAKDIVDEVAPQSERGAKGTTSALSMRDVWAETDYFEHVSITYWHRGSQEVDTNIIAIIIKWRQRSGCQR